MMMIQVGRWFDLNEVIGSEYSDGESDNVHCTTASIVPFMWEDMTNYVGQREIFFL